MITPAVSGPYDFGNVVVRAALQVNPETAQITAISDPLPQILEGVPLRLRSILVELNRARFIINPTNCDPFSVDADAVGDQGAKSSLSEPFQVASCAGLPFSPRLGLKLSGSTMRIGNPALTATLTAKPGDANVASTSVTLPPTELIDNAHIQDPCTKVQFAQGLTAGEKCPPGSMIGFAKAETPLLEKPLEGPVYLRSAGTQSKSGLPDVVAALNGQVDITLDGKIATVRGRLRTTFSAVPDVPVSGFTLRLDGGKKGLLQNNTNLCAHALPTIFDITGQNGKTADHSINLQAPCRKHAQHERRAGADRQPRAQR